jgi:hypothetical protein
MSGSRVREVQKKRSVFPISFFNSMGRRRLYSTEKSNKTSEESCNLIKESDCIKLSWDGLYIPTRLVLVDPNVGKIEMIFHSFRIYLVSFSSRKMLVNPGSWKVLEVTEGFSEGGLFRMET